MSEVIVYDNEFMTVKYLADKGIIYHTIHQPFSGQPFRDAINAGTEALIKYRANKWLSDDRKNGPLSDEDMEWGFTDWNQRAIKAGWRYWAMVVPADLIAAGSLMPTIEDLFRLGLRVSVFAEVDEAIEWLDQMPNE